MLGREKDHIVRDIIKERPRRSPSLPAVDWNVTNYWGY